jgi:hypothetical protein
VIGAATHSGPWVVALAAQNVQVPNLIVRFSIHDSESTPRQLGAGLHSEGGVKHEPEPPIRQHGVRRSHFRFSVFVCALRRTPRLP